MEKVIELFKDALQHEVKSSVFYKKAAETTNNDESRMLLLELCTEEEDHTRHIIEETKNIPSLKDFDAKGYLKELESDMENIVSTDELETVKSGSMRDVLKLAVYIEENAVNKYKELAEHAEDEETKNFCLKLVDEEKKHLNSTTRMLESLDMDEEDRPAL